MNRKTNKYTRAQVPFRIIAPIYIFDKLQLYLHMAKFKSICVLSVDNKFSQKLLIIIPSTDLTDFVISQKQKKLVNSRYNLMIDL